MFKVTARDQGHYKGPSGAFVTYCNISCSYIISIFLHFHHPLRFSLEYLPDKSCYIVNMAISICLEAQDDCDITKVVLENALLPILPCNYDTGFKIPGKSYF